MGLSILTEDRRVGQIEEIKRLLAMKKRLLIWGKGEYSSVILAFLRENGIHESPTFLVDDEFMKESDGDTIRLSDYLKSGVPDDVIIFGFYNYRIIQQKKAVMESCPHLFDFLFAVVQGRRLNWDALEAKRLESEYRKTYALLEDPGSKRTMQLYLNAATAGEFEVLYQECFQPSSYFNGFLQNAEPETLIDCGAFDGDSIHDFVQAFPNYRSILAFEPDPGNAVRILEREKKEQIRNLTLIEKGVYSENTTLFFQANGESNSYMAESGDISVEVTCLDDYREAIVGKALLKMDIEGSELAALKGAERLIREKHPILAICVYHKERDLIDIPQYIHSLVGSGVYRYYLGFHGLGLAELCFYAIPAVTGES